MRRIESAAAAALLAAAAMVAAPGAALAERYDDAAYGDRLDRHEDYNRRFDEFQRRRGGPAADEGRAPVYDAGVDERRAAPKRRRARDEEAIYAECDDFARREAGLYDDRRPVGGGAVRGAVGGAAGGAILGAIIGGRPGLGAGAGAGLGALLGAANTDANNRRRGAASDDVYEAALDDCLRGYR